jgi:hypothetical protein
MRSRLSTDHPFTCVTCEIEIAGPATFHVGLPFCCAGCVANGPCTCSYDRESIDAGVASGSTSTSHPIASPMTRSKSA